jgi:acyl-CoA thioester hydrolase
VQIGTGVRRIGRSSIHIGQVLVQDARRVAEAETVVVQIDTATRQAKSLSPETRERLQGLTLGDSS